MSLNWFCRAEFGEKYGESLLKTLGGTTQKTTQKIIELITANPRISRIELAAVIGITADGIKYQLDKMRKEGVIQRIGPDKGGYWEILTQDLVD